MGSTNLSQEMAYPLHPEDEEPQQGHGAHKDRQGLVYDPLSPDPKDGVGEKALGKEAEEQQELK